MSLQAEINEREAAAANDDANWRAEARETAARINNDIQELMATAHAASARWARVIRGVAEDALSPSAQEAMDVSRG